MGDVGDEPRLDVFFQLHDYLKEQFPGVYSHEAIKLDKVNTFGLLWTWQGTNPDLKPVVSRVARGHTVTGDVLTLGFAAGPDGTPGRRACQPGHRRPLDLPALFGHARRGRLDLGCEWRRWQPCIKGQYADHASLYQRGAGDCKNTLIGLLAAWEKLAEEGFEPTR